MSFELKHATLAYYCEDVSYGYTESATVEPIGPKFLRITDIQGGTIDWSEVPHCPATAQNTDKYSLEVGDIVVARTGNSTGENAQILSKPPTAVFASYLIRFRPDLNRINPFFLGYQLRSDLFKQYVLSVRSGSAQPGANAKQLGAFPVQVIERYKQDEVVKILRALDDRIALLRETNATLEAIAQALFKSWFVDFDPVHANAGTQAPSLPPEIQALFPATFTDSPQGPIPDGWSSGSLGHVAETSRKQLKPEQMSSETLYVGLEHIPRKQLGLDTWGTAEELASNKSAFERNDILFGKLRPYFHKVVVAPIDGVCSTDILVCRSKQTNYHYFVALHLFSDELITYADRLSNGAKMPRINWKDLAAYEVVIPPSQIAETFQNLVEPMINQILANVAQAKTLSYLRDTLLPRLISGQLRLPKAEQAIAAIKD